MDVEPIPEAGAPASGTPRSAAEFLDWVAELHPDGSAATLADVVDRARGIRGDDTDWRPPFMTDTSARADDAAPDGPAGDPAGSADEAGSRLFAPTEINAIYTGPGAPGPPGPGYPPATPPGPRPAPGYGPPPGYPAAFPAPGYRPQPGYPPAYGPPPGYPPQAVPPQAPPPQTPPPQPVPPPAQGPPASAYGAPPGYPAAYGQAPYPPPAYAAAPYAAPQPGYPPPTPAQQVPSPYVDPNGTPGAGVLPAWDALPAQQRSAHFVALPGWAQSLFWAQLNPAQRQELAAVLPPRPGA